MDGINYEVLRNMPDKYLEKILEILNEMYASDTYPNQWNQSFIHFIPKTNGDGVRPLAMTSCGSKLFELMLSNRLRWYVEKNNILPKEQTGFRLGLSCNHNLTSLTLDVH